MVEEINKISGVTAYVRGEKIEVSNDGNNWQVTTLIRIVPIAVSPFYTMHGAFRFARNIKEGFEYGETVEVSDDGVIWHKGTFIAECPRHIHPYWAYCIPPLFGTGYTYCRKIKKEKIVGYTLLKDTPVVKAGAVFKYSEINMRYYPTAESHSSKGEMFDKKDVENNIEWFKPIFE